MYNKNKRFARRKLVRRSRPRVTSPRIGDVLGRQLSLFNSPSTALPLRLSLFNSSQKCVSCTKRVSCTKIRSDKMTCAPDDAPHHQMHNNKNNQRVKTTLSARLDRALEAAFCFDMQTGRQSRMDDDDSHARTSA